MHFTGRTWRPPYEANSFIIQATSGCTHNKCSFCNLYKNEPFKMVSLKEWREDLSELASYQPHARRIFWTGANPFAMNYEHIMERALAVYDYLPEIKTMAMFSSIRDIKNKKVWQLRRLRAFGINGLTIGTETGDNLTLQLANKGFYAKDIIEQCKKLDEAKIEYYFTYMTGLAGKGNGYRNALNSAKVFSKLNPYIIEVDSLTLFKGTELYKKEKAGEYEVASKKERLKELQTFIAHLTIKTHLFANTVSNYYPISGYLPRDKEKLINEIQTIIDTVSEQEMSMYRNNLKSLG